MLDRPLRGPDVRRTSVTLPPRHMPVVRGLRPLKRWRWLGVFSPELLLCAGDALVGPVRRRWWAVAGSDGLLAEGRGGALAERALTIRSGGVEIDLALDPPPAVDVLSPARRAYVWTAKHAPVQVHGTVRLGDGREWTLDGPIGFLDESAGYHDRHTAWKWSAGIGTATDGRAVAWNLVAGVHDGEPSERTVWVDGEPREVGPCAFAGDLSGVECDGATLRFTEWGRRGEDVRVGPLLRSRYVQPFGSFTGALPGGLELASGHGVMEDHDALW